MKKLSDNEFEYFKNILVESGKWTEDKIDDAVILGEFNLFDYGYTIGGQE